MNFFAAFNFLIILIVASIVILVCIYLGKTKVDILSKLDENYFEEFKKHMEVYYIYVYLSKEELQDQLTQCQNTLQDLDSQIQDLNSQIEQLKIDISTKDSKINELLEEIDEERKKILES